MARFIHIEQPAQHAGITRVTRGAAAVAQLHLGHALLALLAGVGAPFVRLGARFGKALEAQAAARHQRREDERLWAVALQDARVMADLSRAMSQGAAEARRYN